MYYLRKGIMVKIFQIENRRFVVIGLLSLTMIIVPAQAGMLRRPIQKIAEKMTKTAWYKEGDTPYTRAYAFGAFVSNALLGGLIGGVLPDGQYRGYVKTERDEALKLIRENQLESYERVCVKYDEKLRSADKIEQGLQMAGAGVGALAGWKLSVRFPGAGVAVGSIPMLSCGLVAGFMLCANVEDLYNNAHRKLAAWRAKTTVSKINKP